VESKPLISRQEVKDLVGQDRPFGTRPENPELLRLLAAEIERLYRELERARRAVE
jgi:hypothetical protein